MIRKLNWKVYFMVELSLIFLRRFICNSLESSLF